MSLNRSLWAGLGLTFCTILVAPACDDSTNLPACTGGHSGEGSCGPWKLPEGGDVRIELQKNGNDGVTIVDAHGYFFKDQSPTARLLDGPQIGMTGCTDLRTGVFFDNGPAPAAQAIADTRTYLDLGASVNIASPEASFALTRKENMMDLSSYLMHDIVYTAEPAGDAVLRDHSYQVSWEATGELGAPDLANPIAVQGVSVKSQLYMPPDLTNISPSFAAPLVLPKTGDLNMSYDQAASALAGAPPILQFAIFFDSTAGQVAFQCVSEATGSINIPREVLDLTPATGYLYFGTFAHIGHEEEGRRLDTVGVNCTYDEYSKAP